MDGMGNVIHFKQRISPPKLGVAVLDPKKKKKHCLDSFVVVQEINLLLPLPQVVVVTLLMIIFTKGPEY